MEEINKTLNLPIDTSAFEQGKVVLLSKTVEGLIQPGQEITIQTQNGQHSFIVANGYLNEGFRAGGGNERGTAPDLYISQTALKELFRNIECSAWPLIRMVNMTKVYCKN